MKSITFLLVLLLNQLALIAAQDASENPHVTQGKNPYCFLYYGIFERKDDFFDIRNNIKHNAMLLENGGKSNSSSSSDNSSKKNVFGYDYIPYYKDDVLVRPNVPKVAAFLGYMNLTEEDESVWDTTNHIRLCLHFFKDNNPNVREMVRFVSKNPIADTDGNAMDSAFIAQYTNSQEHLDNPKYWCSRRHDWSGINKEIKHVDSASLGKFEPAKNPGMPLEAIDAYKRLTGNMTLMASTGGYYVASQLQFIEEKSDMLGLDYIPTRFWVKQSAHVAFRRAAVPTDIPGQISFNPSSTYKVMIQYGLFSDDQDEDESKVKGATSFEMAKTFLMPQLVESGGRWLKATAIGALVFVMSYV